MSLGIFDGDGLVYAVCAVTERDDFDDGNWEADIPAAISLLEMKMLELEKAVGPFQTFLGFKSQKNFRFAVESTYKGNRKDKRRPEGLEELKKHCVDRYKAIKCVGAETDDVVCYWKRKQPWRLLIAMDKDVTGQSVGIHYDYKKKEFLHTYQTHATFFKYWQAIIGDSGDGYKGVPGIGAVGAAKFIDEWMSEIDLQKGVLEAFESKGLGMDDALIQVRLADMHQFNPETKKVTLFTFDKTLDKM